MFAMDSINHALSGCHDIGHRYQCTDKAKKVIIGTGISICSHIHHGTPNKPAEKVQAPL